MSHANSSISYRRGWGLLVVACLGAIGGFAWASRWSLAENNPIPALREDGPNSRLTPEQVVELQMRALQSYPVSPDGAARCFEFASPANKAETGPIDRFTQILHNEDYKSLLAGGSALVGRAVIVDRYATVLVSKWDVEGRPIAFRFFLSKQEHAPFTGCWMTDAVQPAAHGPAPAGNVKPSIEPPLPETNVNAAPLTLSSSVTRTLSGDAERR